MNKPTVISVNPSQVAEGSRYPEMFGRKLAVPRYEVRTASSATLLSIILPTRRSGIAYSLIALIGRLLAAVALLWSTGVETLLSGSATAIGAIVGAAMMVVGLLTRPAALVAVVYYILGLAGGHFELLTPELIASMSLVTLVAIAGPGRISLDRLICRLVRRRQRRRPRSISYRAWREAF